MMLTLCVPASSYALNFTSGAYKTITPTVKTLSGEENLLPVFEDTNAAIKQFEKEFPDFIKEIQKGKLPSINLDNAEDYKEYAIATEQDSDIVEFFDILENSSKNDGSAAEITSIVEDVDKSSKDRTEAQEEIELLLPLSSSPSTDSIISGRALDVSSAKAYALKYALSPNPKYGVEKTRLGLEVDCTNFASQILYAGGIPMNISGSTNNGWWWKARGNRSVSWIRAATFAKYMGSTYRTTNWKYLKANVVPGDFIGYDQTNDGEVDHIAFIYDKDGSKVSIAQHTDNYIRWDSSTGWPKLQNGTLRYYRIRR